MKEKTETAYVRRRGVLVPVFSLPSKYGIGTLGKTALDFIDAIAAAGASIWAILPTGVTGYGDSPYQSFSSYALNPYFLDLDALVFEGLLTKEECASADFGSDPARVDYGKLYENRLPLLMTAYARFIKNPDHEKIIEKFEKTVPWLDDFARFTAIKEEESGKPWYEWPDGLKNREPAAMAEIAPKIACEVGFHKFLQFKLARQWSRLKRYAEKKGVLIMGDLPIYCAYDSADCWAYRDNFRFDGDGRPTLVAGVPPDYFCEDGQLWGNPVYDWEFMRKDRFGFWLGRLRRASELYDILRIDHFRGFASYYAVPAGAPNARNGEWIKAEGERLFNAAKKEKLPVEIVAEDLGFITPDVKRLLTKTGFAGMQVMEFAFDNDRKNPHKNKRWDGDESTLKNKIAYTGTHDNPPLAEWWEGADERTRELAEKYAGEYASRMPRGIVKATLRSDARYALVPFWDVLLLGPEARMNTPATASGNWTRRLAPSEYRKFKKEIKDLFN
ncbi:MAG: 4-alpha-glucanotransferase [Clostridiales bacterium]|nr:4-alpha-glucanotransferase [Clostridiales bacterium]